MLHQQSDTTSSSSTWCQWPARRLWVVGAALGGYRAGYDDAGARPTAGLACSSLARWDRRLRAQSIDAEVGRLSLGHAGALAGEDAVALRHQRRAVNARRHQHQAALVAVQQVAWLDGQSIDRHRLADLQDADRPMGDHRAGGEQPEA